MKKNERNWKAWITDNGSYKLVALFVTLILWVTILGRGDIVMTKDVGLEFLLPKELVLAEQRDLKVSVEVAGPRMALKKFGQNPGTITVDLSRGKAGRNRAIISPKNVEVPFGVKVRAIKPEWVDVKLIPVGDENGKGI
ncbi:MAG: hypothetical protein NDI61_03730 [Bdellovibrionaceae bacterium]|nr:hypothetical protein [Pseudobdellovibrionaceae bacterium]